MNIELLDQSAKSPTLNEDGSYSIYANEFKIINPSEMTSIKTGVMITIPKDYYTLIDSAQIVASNAIETSRYINLKDMQVRLYNYGKSPYTVEYGQEIGKLLFIKLKTDLQNGKKSKQEIEDEPEKVEIIKDTKTWFIKCYKNKIDKVMKLLTKTHQNKINEFKKTNIYEMAADKNLVEAKYMWEKILDAETKNKLGQQFAETQKKLLSDKNKNKKKSNNNDDE